MPDAPPLLDPEALARVQSLELRARLIVDGFITGLHRSPYHGFSVEFAEHRPYYPGDDLRHVDWKVFARTDRHVVKRFEAETNLRHYAVLDTSPSMRYRGAGPVSKLHWAATLAAAVSALAVRQRDAAGLVAFDRTVHTLVPPRTTRSALQSLLATLAEWAGDPEEADASGTEPASNVAAALHEVAERVPRRSFLTVFTDAFDTGADPEELVRALRHLRYRGHEVAVFHVLDGATERAFALGDTPVILRDLETGETLQVHPAQLQGPYQTLADAFAADLRRRCRQHRIDFEEADTAAPYETALRAWLGKRRRMP